MSSLRQFYRAKLFSQTALCQLFCGAPSLYAMVERNRVKRLPKQQNGDNPRFSGKPLGKRTMQIRHLSPVYTAVLPPLSTLCVGRG